MPVTEWEFRFDRDEHWRPIAVPGCWEDAGYPKDRPGPGWYRTRLHIPHAFAGRQLLLRFGAVSYACDVYANGRLCARHLGAWDAFEVDITTWAEAGAVCELLLRVEKPASLSAGPASAAMRGAFPLKTTLAGFLPYVWGHLFGGVWQPVELVAAAPVRFVAASACGTPAGDVEITAELTAPTMVQVELRDPDGALLPFATEDTARTEGETANSSGSSVPAVAKFTAHIPTPRPWSPNDPALYTATLRADGDERIVRFGLRSLRAAGATLLLNEQPIYPRMILSWGWYAETLCPNPGPERVRADFARLKAMGYNGVKLCLWFPPQYYFDIADELGILLWVELPMWLPEPDAHFRRQTPLEYERLVRLAAPHPSVILYSLGCELNRAVGPDILGPLYALVKQHGGGALVRDNSGSGEAYGGLLNEFADYYDYHFYCDLQFFRTLVDFFSPRWRPEQPWIFGEYCDYDTFRQHNGKRPSLWWFSQDAAVNPQGARWQMDAPFLEERLQANGYLARAAELERLSHLHGLLHRKYTIELTRMYREIGGYVITGEADTPISTAGMWDDAGRPKFDPDTFRAFNRDTVLALGWDKRRAWINGGDRWAPWDTFSHTAGTVIRPHIVVSHYGTAVGLASIAWSVAFDGEAPFAGGTAETSFTLAPGELRELLVAEFLAPTVTSPRQATLHAEVRIGNDTTSNAWPLWFFPAGAWDAITGVALLDPAHRLDGLTRLAPGMLATAEAEIIEWTSARTAVQANAKQPNRNLAVPAVASVILATSWTPALDAFVRSGGRAILLHDAEGPPGPIPALPMPFWREAVRLCEAHPAWGDFPHDRWAALQFYGCAADHALDTASLGADIQPILRRIDTRTAHYHDYACELAWGAGRLLVATLRFHGGNGDQPAGIGRNTAAAYLLSCWVKYLL
jgi:hypothetical protein